MRPELTRLLRELDPEAAGRAIHQLATELQPLPRSLTGDGVRRTLEVLARRIPLVVHEVPSGTQAFDWTVPREWNVRGAWIEDPAGRRFADFAESPLHLLGYSVPVDARVDLEELRAHLHSLPDRPDLVPYRTSYYQERWGFCLAHREVETLVPGEYRVRIDATLEPGHLTYGEVVLPGESDEVFLLSTHVCHPALANDNLSGIGVLVALAELLAPLRLRYTYRFVFAPGTIGAIVWLARNAEAARRVRHGLVAANLGDAGRFHYKRSRAGGAPIDRAVAVVLRDAGEPHSIEDFVPFGYDERQYNSPGFALPVGSLTRTPWGRYPEYHTSADDLAFVRPDALGESLRRYLQVVHVLEHDLRFRNLAPYGEPQLGRRGLYRSLGGDERGRERELALLWVLNLSDGEASLLDVAERSGMPFAAIVEAAEALLGAGLLGP